MANFNETIKATKSGRISVASYCDIVICKTMKEFQKAVCNNHMNSYFMCSESKNFNAFCRAEHPVNEMETVFDYPYMEDNYQSLHIEYKSTHRNAKIAGRSYFWTNDDEDLNGVECGKPYGDDKGFGIPRFDGIESAVYMDDYEIILYNGTVEADLEDEFTVRLHIFAGDKEINETMISTEEFNDYFKLDENFLNYDEIFWESEDEPIHPYCDCWREPTEEEVEADTQKLLALTAEDEAKATESAQIVAETATESTDDDETTKHTANVENASEWTIDETGMNDIQWLCKWLSERRPEYNAVCKWMYEREKERKTEDSLDAKETRDAVMVVGGSGGGWRRREWQKRVRNEIETHRIAI